MKLTLLTIAFILYSNCGYSQSPCETLPYQAIPEIENQITEWILKNKKTLQTRSTVTIPVVVHIVYNSATENISDADIYNQINILNRDFRRRNADSTQTPSVWKTLAADIDIEFCLASKDTLGNPTTGITRTQTPTLVFSNSNNVKNSFRGGIGNWNPRKYLNIWVCNLNTALFGLGSYPTFLDARPQDDGVVINYRNFSSKPPKVLGRVLVHEVGHWFNLIHIFGDSIVTSCFARSDLVDDTPTQRDPSIGCFTFPKWDVCTTMGSGTMFMNYMDYTDELCMNLFTLGQKERMLAALNLFRSDILTSNGCSTVPTEDISLSPFSISPNPIRNGLLKIDNAEKNADLWISNIYGQVVFTKKNIAETELIDFSNQPDGLYFITMKKGYKSLTVKALCMKP